MRQTRWCFVLISVAVLMLFTMTAVSCGRDNETIAYLTAMHQWRDKWDEAYIGSSAESFESAVYPLVKELSDIRHPGKLIPLKFGARRPVDYWTAFDHEYLTSACRVASYSQATLKAVEEAERLRCLQEGIDYDYYYDPEGIGIMGSPQFVRASMAADESESLMFEVTSRLDMYFFEYRISNATK